MEIRQSDLSSYGRCAQQKRLYDMARAGLVKRPSNLSATVFGTIMHHALQTLERLHAEGRADALEVAKSTFAHYWDPEHLPEMAVHHPELVHGIDEWLPKQTYGGLRMKGLRCLDDYYALLRTDTGTLLGLELDFRVPIDLTAQGVPGFDKVRGDGGQHYLKGTIDKLMMRRFNRKPYLSIEDFKTGKQQWNLRYNNQFTVYSFASLQRAFWDPWDEQAQERFEFYLDWPRRGNWFNVSEVKGHDAGWRGPQDYERMKVALAEYVKANEADVFPLTLTGETCKFCAFRDGTCGGIPVPDESYGKPA